METIWTCLRSIGQGALLILFVYKLRKGSSCDSLSVNIFPWPWEDDDEMAIQETFVKDSKVRNSSSHQGEEPDAIVEHFLAFQVVSNIFYVHPCSSLFGEMIQFD